MAIHSWKQISHKINKLSFGEEFPGVVNPLDGYAMKFYCISLCSATYPLPDFPEISRVEWTQDNSNGLTGMYQYFVKVNFGNLWVILFKMIPYI